MNELVLDDGFGFARVTVRTEAGPRTAVLDLWEANNTYVALARKHNEDAIALAADWCDWLAGKGLAGLSHGAAFKIQDHVAESIEALKKSDPPPPPSPTPG